MRTKSKCTQYGNSTVKFNCVNDEDEEKKNLHHIHKNKLPCQRSSQNFFIFNKLMSFDLKYIVENKCLHKYASLSPSIVNRCSYGSCGREPRATVAGCLVLTTGALNSFRGVSFLLARAISWWKTAKLEAHLSKCHTPVSPLYSRYYNHFTHISCTLFHLL